MDGDRSTIDTNGMQSENIYDCVISRKRSSKNILHVKLCSNITREVFFDIFKVREDLKFLQSTKDKHNKIKIYEERPKIMRLYDIRLEEFSAFVNVESLQSNRKFYNCSSFVMVFDTHFNIRVSTLVLNPVWKTIDMNFLDNNISTGSFCNFLPKNINNHDTDSGDTRTLKGLVNVPRFMYNIADCRVSQDRIHEDSATLNILFTYYNNCRIRNSCLSPTCVFHEWGLYHEMEILHFIDVPKDSNYYKILARDISPIYTCGLYEGKIKGKKNTTVLLGFNCVGIFLILKDHTVVLLPYKQIDFKDASWSIESRCKESTSFVWSATFEKSHFYRIEENFKSIVYN